MKKNASAVGSSKTCNQKSRQGKLRARRQAFFRFLVQTAFAASSIALLTGPQAQAVNYYWDSNGATAGSGAANGTWGTSVFWSTDALGSTALSAVTTTNADDLFFSAGTNGTAGTVAVSGTQSAHSLTFDDPVAITVSGGTAINLGSATAGSGLFFTNPGASANTVSTAIVLNSGATALNFTNSGTSLQTVSGTITGAAPALTTQVLTLGANGTGGLNLSGVISNGAGGGNVGVNINSAGTGFTVLGANNTYTGGFTLTNGRVILNNAGAAGAATGSITLAGGTLDSTSGVTLNSAPQTWSGDFSFGGQTVFNNTPAGRNLNLGAGLVTLTGNRTVTVDGNNSLAARATNNNVLTVGGDISGAFALTKAGAGTLSLSDITQTFNGGLVLNGGALRVGADAGWNLNTVTFNGGVFEYNYAPVAPTLGTLAGQFNMTNGGGFSAVGGNRTVGLNGNAPLIWGSTASFVGNGSSLKFGGLNSANELLFTNAIDLGGTTRTIDATRGTGGNVRDGVLSGAITNGSIIKTGNGTVDLTSTSTVLGGVTIAGGTLGLTNTTFAGTNVLLDGGSYRASADYTGALGSGSGQLRFAGGASDGGFTADGTNRTFNIGGAGATLAWNSTANFLGTGALRLSSSSSNATTIITNGLDFNGADRTIYVEDGNAAIDARIDGVISGTGNLLKTGGAAGGGGARLFLTGANTYTGATTIRNGEIVINSSVLNNTASPLGNSSNTIFLTDASSLSLDGQFNGGLASLNVQGLSNTGAATAIGDAQQITIARNIDVSGASTASVFGRTRIGLFGNGGAGIDTNKLILSGNIALGSGGRALELFAERAGQTIEVASPNITGTGTVFLTGNIGNNNANDGRSNGTFRFTDVARTYAGTISLTYGTLVIEGSVGATGVASAIGTQNLSMSDGNGGNILQGSGRDAMRSLFLETDGATFNRTLSPAGFGQVTPTSALYGTSSVTMGNGYRFGGLNTTGTVTFAQNISPGTMTQSTTGSAGGPGGTNALSVVHNIALMAANGGTVNFAGAIAGATPPATGSLTPGNATSTGNLTRITINQFRNHPNLDEDVNGQADAGIANALVGNATAGTVVLSGTNSYGGSTEILGGTLRLNYLTNNTTKLADAAALILSGGTVELSGGTHTEVVGSTAITGNTTNTINRSAGTSTLRLNAINRGVGGYLNFGASGIADTDTLNTNGILGPWATINGTDYAQNSTNAADGLITAYTTYTDVARLDGASQIIDDGAATNVRIVESTGTAANITLGAASTNINTLNQSINGGTSAATIDPAGQTLRTNAILLGSGAGGLTIGTGANNGTLTSATSAAGSELILQNFSSNGVTINSVVADNTTAGNLTVGGLGTTTLTGANTYTGSTLVNSGVLNIRNSAALGSVSASVTSGAITVGVNTPGNAGQAVINTANTTGLAVGQAISGPGIQAGSFITAVNPGVSFTVSQNLNTAASTVANAYQVGGTTVANGAALEMQGGITVGAEALTIGGSGISNGGALRSISGTNSFAGAITLTADTRINSDTAGDTLTLSGGIPSAITPTSAYALTFGGAGNTLVSGVIAISPTASGYLSTLTKDGTGTLTLSANNTYGGPTTISAGTLQLGNGGTTGLINPNSSLTNNGTFVINRSNGLTQGTDFAPIINGTGAVTIASTTTTALNGANTYDGVTTISKGVLAISNNTSLGSTVGNTVINSTGTTNLAAVSPAVTGGQLALSNNITIGENIVIQGTGDGTGNQFTRAIDGATTASTNTINGTITLTGTSSYRIGVGNGAGVLNVGLIQRSTPSSGNLTFDPTTGGRVFVNQAIDNNGGQVTAHGGGTVVLTASNNDIGAVIIQNLSKVQITANNALALNQTLSMGQNGAVNGGVGVNNDVATFIFDATSQTIGSLNGFSNAGVAPNNASATNNRLITSTTATAKTLTVGNGNASGGFDGVIENGSGGGTTSFTKIGTGTQSFFGTVANTYTGDTTVSGGSLVLAKTAGINAVSGNLVIGDGTGNDIVQLTNSNQIADTSLVSFSGTGANAGILRLNNQSETIVGLSSSAGAGIVENNNATAGTSLLTSNVASGSTVFSGILRNNAANTTNQGVLAFTKDGAGTQVFTGASSYSGATIVNAGTLLANNATGSALGASNVTVEAAGTFGGTGSITGLVALNGGVLSPGASIESLTIGGLSGTGGLLIEYDGSAGQQIDFLDVAGNIDATGITLNFASLGAALADPFYVFAKYSGTLTGTFAAINAQPAGYLIDYDYLGNKEIALVTAVPEPGTIALLVMAGIGGGLYRRSRNSKKA